MKVPVFLVAFWFTNVGVGGCGQLPFTFYISQKGIRSSLCCQVVSVSVYQCSAQFACVVLLTESYFNLTQYEPRADLRGSVLLAREYQLDVGLIERGIGVDCSMYVLYCIKG